MISLNWVGDYVDIANEDISELTDKITKFGVNIEKVISYHNEYTIIFSNGDIWRCAEASELTADTEFRTLDEWDSVAYISVIAMMDEEYDISYSELKEMEVGDSIDWGTENDDYEVIVMFKDDDGVMVRITRWNSNPWMEEEPEVEVKYFQWI